jgi:hypothetical protein
MRELVNLSGALFKRNTRIGKFYALAGLGCSTLHFRYYLVIISWPSPSCLKNAGELFMTLLGCARLEIALYVEPRSAVLEKLRGAINHSHAIMKHIIGRMDAT